MIKAKDKYLIRCVKQSCTWNHNEQEFLQGLSQLPLTDLGKIPYITVNENSYCLLAGSAMQG